MNPPRRRTLLLATGFTAGALVAVAQEVVDEKAETGPPDRFAARGKEPPARGHDLERLSRNWQDWHSRSDERGFHWEFGYTAEVLAAVAGGKRTGATAEGLSEIELRIEPERWGAWPGLRFDVSGLYPHGRGLSDRFTGDLFAVSNLDAYDSPRLYELWVEQTFFEGQLSIRAGQLAAETDFILGGGSDALLNGTFGWPAFMALNTPAPAYPLTTPGIRLGWKPSESLWLNAAIFDGDPDPGGAAGEPVNPHGVRYNFSEGALILAEAGWQRGGSGAKGIEPAIAAPPLESRFRIGGWYHTDTFEDLARDATGDWVTGDRTAATHAGNFGLYAIADQQVWRSVAGERGNRTAALFARVAGAPSDRNRIPFYLEGGVHARGLFPTRLDDVTSLGVAWGRMSPDLRGLAGETARLTGTSTRLPDYELVLEVTHRMELRPGWTLQPDVQWIVHPGGSSAIPDAVVIGLRTALVF